MTTEPRTDVPTTVAAPREVPGWSFLPIGAAAALLGLLPWLVTGARLPLQNLWAGAPADAPIVLLPFSQYAISLIGALVIVGALAAGIAGRALGAASAKGAAPLLVAGVVSVQLIAIAQTAATVHAGLRIGDEATIYVAGLTTGAVFVVLVGVGVMLLLVRAPRAGALIGLVVGAIAMSTWISAFIAPLGSAPVDAPSVVALVLVTPWITPVLAGNAIAWAGVDTPGRIVAALASVILVWVAPAVLTGISSALGTRIYANSPGDMLDYGMNVFGLALLIPELALRPIIGVLITAAIGLGIRWLLTRRRASVVHTERDAVAEAPRQETRGGEGTRPA